MAEKLTLTHPETGHTVITDNQETISNLHFGRGYAIVREPEPVKPATTDAASAAERPDLRDRKR